MFSNCVLVGLPPKVTYRIGVYSKLHKEQIGKIWNTSLITLTRKEVKDFHEQRRKGEFIIVGDTIQTLLQDEVFDSVNTEEV